MAYPVPLLTFNDPTGLDLPAFNTIRLGGGWKKRLKRGCRVLLATKFEVIGSAKVSYVSVGRANIMLPAYAFENHIELVIQMETPDGYSRLAAGDRRLESMRKNYGPSKVKDTSLVTVIGLKRT